MFEEGRYRQCKHKDSIDWLSIPSFNIVLSKISIEEKLLK